MKSLSEIPWRTVSTRPIYQNRWLSLREDLVGVLPFLEPDTVLLVRQ
jgi:hypothetical protein